MDAVSTLKNRFETMRDDGRWGVLLSVLAIAFLIGGYTVGSVLAGESLGDQVWAVPLLGGCVAILSMLASPDT